MPIAPITHQTQSQRRRASRPPPFRNSLRDDEQSRGSGLARQAGRLARRMR